MELEKRTRFCGLCGGARHRRTWLQELVPTLLIVAIGGLAVTGSPLLNTGWFWAMILINTSLWMTTEGEAFVCAWRWARFTILGHREPPRDNGPDREEDGSP